MQEFDISKFALPNAASGEWRFEEPRDIQRIVLKFPKELPARPKIHYMKKYWPEQRHEENIKKTTTEFGLSPIDDWFTAKWVNAKIKVEKLNKHEISITFKGLKSEFSDLSSYDVDFRRTLGFRISGCSKQPTSVKIYTPAPSQTTKVRVEFDAGKTCNWKSLTLSGYNASIDKINTGKTFKSKGKTLTPGRGKSRSFTMQATHMITPNDFSGDEGLITFTGDRDTFTISLDALAFQGPVWNKEAGIYIADAGDARSFADYQAEIKETKTLTEQVLAKSEQTLRGSFLGQPRPHKVATSIGCKFAQQRFWLECYGDLMIHSINIRKCSTPDFKRFAFDPKDYFGGGRFFFGLESAEDLGHFPDPAPVLAQNNHFRRGDIRIEQKSFAVPLEKSILKGDCVIDDTVIALLCFTFHNDGQSSQTAELPLSVSTQSLRSEHGEVPDSEMETLQTDGGWITGKWNRKKVIRAFAETKMTIKKTDDGLRFSKSLTPGKSCQLILKVPYIAVDQANEKKLLKTLDADKAYKELGKYWRRECGKGTRLSVPNAQLENLHDTHLAHIAVTDNTMLNDPDLVTTSVG
ncbi:MAG: hypothetical protein HRT89_17020, partial [Lentisphaeria bacterium]|nr:hypothetical protein [Lentisphaeria bacterium]NQZ69762.1 hypothetical protein [Lentisphaeria bacterium]